MVISRLLHITRQHAEAERDRRLRREAEVARTTPIPAVLPPARRPEEAPIGRHAPPAHEPSDTAARWIDLTDGGTPRTVMDRDRAAKA